MLSAAVGLIHRFTADVAQRWQRAAIDRQAYLGSWRPAVRSWAVVLSGLALAQGAGALSTIIVARRVLPVDYGQYVACLSLSGLLVVLPNFGFDSWLLARGTIDRGLIARQWRTALRARLPLLGLWLFGIVGLGFVLPRATFPWLLLISLAIDVGADCVLLLAFGGLRILGQHRTVTWLQAAGAIAVVGAAISLPVGPGQIVVFAICQAGIAVVVALLATWVTARRLRTTLPPVPLDRLIQEARPFMLGDLAYFVYSRAGLTWVALLVGAGGAGVFGPALSLVALSFLVPAALYFFILPVLARGYHALPARRFAALAGVQVLAQGLVGLSLSAMVFLLAPPLIRLIFGGVYDASIPILRALSPLPFLKSLDFGLGAWLTATQRQASRTKVQFVAAAASAGLGIVAIYAFGIAGAAVMEILAESILFIGYAGSVRRTYRA